MPNAFDPDCRECPRLAAFLDAVKDKNCNYYCRPVPSFGDVLANFLIVGLAPGMHGANRTGRPFTGDYAGILLYEVLYEFGFSNQVQSLDVNDDLQLRNCRITNAVKCLPPKNKPLGAEINTCNKYLTNELRALASPGVILALGGIAHRAIIRAMSLKQVDYPFGHAAEYEFTSGIILLDSYHCSRYNTNTGRLTGEMFRSVFSRASELLTQAAR
jgi:uracil-DNA glycosylase family 4